MAESRFKNDAKEWFQASLLALVYMALLVGPGLIVVFATGGPQ